MKEFIYKINNQEGMHMLAMTKLANLADRFESKITLTKNNTTMNCRSLMSLIVLAVKCDETVFVRTEGKDEDQAFKAMEAYFEKNF